MRVSVCCIGKNENRYVREFIDHYKATGVDKIFLYDNNDPNGERFEDVIGEEIKMGFVELVDYRGQKVCQLRAYQECYDCHNEEYDWMLFVDLDEFWHSQRFEDNIKRFLGQRKFNSFDMIHVNWLCFGDNNHLFYEDKSLKERFPKPLPVNNVVAYKKDGIPENFHIKSFIRGKKIVYWKSNPHTPYPSRHLPCADSLGNETNPEAPLSVIMYTKENYNESSLWHYTTKSAEEYVWKMKRGFPDSIIDKKNIEDLINTRFFRTNIETDEKWDMFKKEFGIYKEHTTPIQSLKIFAYSHIHDFFLKDYFEKQDCYEIAYEDEIKSQFSEGNLNKSINEGHGISYVWENKLYRDYDYVGFCHYRRHLNLREVNEGDKFKVIVAKPIHFYNSVYEQWDNPQIFLDTTLKLIKDYSPEIYATAMKHMRDDYMYYSNNFIMRKEDFEEYGKFVFTIIKNFCKEYNFKSYDDIVEYCKTHQEIYPLMNHTLPSDKKYAEDVHYNCRTLGFILERLTSIWMVYRYRRDEIKEVSLVVVENRKQNDN